MQNMTPIAVVGMAGLFPGAADLNSYWHNIVNRVDTTCEVPDDRWIVAPATMVDPISKPDKAFSGRACLLKDFVFDPNGLDIDKELLSELDPLYQIVLHVGREAFSSCKTAATDKERVGTVLAAIALPTDTASFVAREILGTSFTEKLLGRPAASTPFSLNKNRCLSGRVTGLPAAIIARSLGLGGGSYTLDAACASSLYAVKLACDELQEHRADAMLAGGVSRPECLYTQVGFSQLRALSPTGRCAPFDKTANGLVVGEGAGLLVLKRLEDALKDGDTIYALIRGLGLSNDLHGNLLSPDSEGQVRAMRKAYDAAGWTPGDVDLIECHGAGTPLGDLTELRSLVTLWGETGWQRGQCPIGSVKSMVGHLLTAAGAAGMIKTLLAMHHSTLPPSLNFSEPPDASPLPESPFRVQTTAEKWIVKAPGIPRRAAVSAFGFGGINAHLLFEEWLPDTAHTQQDGRHRHSAASTALDPDFSEPSPQSQAVAGMPSNIREPVAIVGMDASVGSLNCLRAFQEAVFNAKSIFTERPPARWKGSDTVAKHFLNGRSGYGAFLKDLSFHAGEFHIPPNEIPDILPQHLLMLKIAAGAMKDADLRLREDRPDMSVFIGMGFDYEATNFHIRWNLHNTVGQWARQFGLHLDAHEKALWLESLQDACAAPLNANRTLGALGGIIASRIAREFRLGGPSFVVSGEETSGLRALEIAFRALQKNEIETALVGAVDIAGDVRAILTADVLRPFSQRDHIHAFDENADGTLVGEGAVAMVLKRLDQAVAEGHRIYAVINGIGAAGAGGIDIRTTTEAYTLSLNRALFDAGVAPDSIGYMEAHGSGDPSEDRMEAEALRAAFPDREDNETDACAVGSVKPVIGHVGAAAGLFSVVKSCLCLYQELLPPLRNFKTPGEQIWHQGPFHFPIEPQYWFRNQCGDPRRACVGAITTDGNCMHIVLEEASSPNSLFNGAHTSEVCVRERKHPLGLNPYGLFVVEGNSPDELVLGLNLLADHARRESDHTQKIEGLARRWFMQTPPDLTKKCAVSIVATGISHLQNLIARAKTSVLKNTPNKGIDPGGSIRYSAAPLGPEAEIAFVFPGSGNHYVGMGRGIGVRWPEILRDMDRETPELKSQARPHHFIPWRTSWQEGWELEAERRIASAPLSMIFGSVVHGCMIAKLVKTFALQPAAVIGYSLGESAALFAMDVWPDRGEMLNRMRAGNLFTTELGGPCNALRNAWEIPSNEPIHWCVAVINRPAGVVREKLSNRSQVRLLIVNTPAECVIGGLKNQIEALVRDLGCEAVYLNGVATVHCDAVRPVADPYRALHLFPVTPCAHVRFYSCAQGKAYDLNSDSVADAILKQALEGFDFTATIRQAHADGARIFIEMGPHSSCTRMIQTILKGRPHLAVSSCIRGEDDFLTILKLLAALIAERIPLKLEALYAGGVDTVDPVAVADQADRSSITLQVGSIPSIPPLPAKKSIKSVESDLNALQPLQASAAAPDGPFAEILAQQGRNITAISDTHLQFLDFSGKLQQAFSETHKFQARILEKLVSQKSLPDTGFNHSAKLTPPTGGTAPVLLKRNSADQLAFSRDKCMQFAVGSVADVLGPEFAVVDTYNVRVRLPDEPLMLVDRILTIEGHKGALGSGRIVTEHDVLPGAWYLDGDRAPVCISVEAGQADLFLCAYLGIDLRVRGKRAYRLLDATVEFHRGLPRPGDCIRYDIRIEKFARQGDTYLFFFNFDGFIGDEHLISMTSGCAGFFTPQEVENSGGIISTEDGPRRQFSSKAPELPALQAILPKSVEQYDEKAVQALRTGNLSDCFGPVFEGVRVSDSLRLPGGRMKLIDRVISLDPNGGRYGLGVIRAEADVQPDDWYLTCHFMDDMVMPGTLMYECCAHTLRIFLQRMGWILDKEGVCYEPVIGVQSVLKCRGPVTPETKRVVYEVEIKETGFNPEPFVIADAHMYADDRYIVLFRDMSMKMSGATRDEIETFWQAKRQAPVFDREHILAFATGKPSKAFGPAFKVFDKNRFIARLPAPPYSFIDRITRVAPPAGILKPDGWIQAEYDFTPDEWYFRADRSGYMPFCILLEIALQPCGWLAAYAGSALRSEKDLKFRNLGGEARLYHPVPREKGRLTTRTRLTQVSEAGEMIIEHFEFQVQSAGNMIYEGKTYFGFFTTDALAKQVGLRDISRFGYVPRDGELEIVRPFVFPDEAPLSPNDLDTQPSPPLALPSKAIRMIDEIETCISDGGPHGLGMIRGLKRVDPNEWFFKAHFFQDPVCPGSLGIESFLQLIKFMAKERWGHSATRHNFAPILDQTHRWTYRGQVVPDNKAIEVEAVVTRLTDTPDPQIAANGFLRVDGINIYGMENFGFRLLTK